MSKEFPREITSRSKCPYNLLKWDFKLLHLLDPLKDDLVHGSVVQ